ncbi:MAG: hypothetical protein A3F10_04895 [Coxiella sp. RIFCSPHIGHO2_12_FULL_42_15]|nr:MAG: hypothetical protein A3F10_04895 [Coxiella sp. RIFCSPHIGHO2_12_FULL_42_15]
MSKMSINFIGCGRLGKTIASLFKRSGIAEVATVCNSSFESSCRAVHFIGQGSAVKCFKELSPAHIFFITSRDDQLSEICNQLVDEQALKPGMIVVHCSGSLSSDILAKAQTIGCYTASIHPIKSFADPATSINNFSGTYCAIEGDEQAKSIIRELFRQIGGIPFDINKENKHLYHAAGAMANNYLVTLHYHAVQCYKSAGVDENVANEVVSMLMNDALLNINKYSHAGALTGPIQRGDINTVKTHINALENNPAIKALYLRLGLSTLPLTDHANETKKKLEEILCEPSSNML